MKYFATPHEEHSLSGILAVKKKKKRPSKMIGMFWYRTVQYSTIPYHTLLETVLTRDAWKLAVKRLSHRWGITYQYRTYEHIILLPNWSTIQITPLIIIIIQSKYYYIINQMSSLENKTAVTILEIIIKFNRIDKI